MIGLKTVAAVGLTALLLALGGLRHALDPSTLRHLSPGACFLAGLVAGLAVALLGVGWRFGVRSRSALAVIGGRPAVIERLAEGARPRELPGIVQRGLLLAGFASIAIAGIGNHAAARIMQLPDELAAPAPSEYCLPEPAAPAAPAPREEPAQPVEQPGCALVLRAFKLGYAKTLGSCAPRKAAPAAAAAPVAAREVCTRRQLDEPFLHYGFRRVAGAARSATAVDPVAAAEHRASEFGAHFDYLDGLLADINHAITGSPHAAHHLWVNLPDPHPHAVAEYVTGSERCSQRFADLPLWPAWRPGDEARMVEHVLGQLLFATRFGTTASCSDHVIHWDAAPDTCRRLASEPIAVLERDGALASVRAVLDRRRRQLEIGELSAALGRRPPVAPPAAGAIVSLACLVVEPTAPAGATDRAPTGTTVAVDGDAISLRELHVPAVRTGGDGPIDVYAGLALLLGGRGGDLAAALRQPEPVEPAGDDFLLARLDPLIDADPFRGVRAPLDRPELVELYPFEHHLHGFIDGFRRRYLAQRGRL
ncbi:MAG TPA: hypothetical protein VK607_08760, partial [Kofleriaceae bacterium]|nr:hypothetical protein [Kofleriaceae bacterium]